MLIYKLDYVLEKEDARRRDAAQAAAYASRAVRPGPGTLTYKLRRLAKELVAVYLTHQSWKAHDGIFTPIPLTSEQVSEEVPAWHQQSQRRALRKLAGVKLSTSEAQEVWPRILEHKWYLSERLGRDVGLRVAAVDYFENIEPPPPPVSYRKNRDPLPPRLPMMLRLGERP